MLPADENLDEPFWYLTITNDSGGASLSSVSTIPLKRARTDLQIDELQTSLSDIHISHPSQSSPTRDSSRPTMYLSPESAHLDQHGMMALLQQQIDSEPGLTNKNTNTTYNIGKY